MNPQLQQTRRRLSIQFAAIFLVLVWLIGVGFFLIRGMGFRHVSKKALFDQRTNIEKIILKKNQNVQFKKGRPFEYLIVEKGTLEVIQERHFSFTTEELLEILNSKTPLQNPIEMKKNDEVYKISVSEWRDPHSEKKFYIFIINRFPFNMEFFIYEALYFILFSLILSFLVYIIGYYFTGRNLQPVQDMINKLEQFTHDASHELKTPIAVMFSDLKLAEKTGKYKSAVHSAIDEIKTLNSLVNKLLVLAQPDEQQEYTTVANCVR